MATKKQGDQRLKEGSERALKVLRRKESAELLDRACGSRYLTLCVVRCETGHGHEDRIIAQPYLRGELLSQVSWGLGTENLAERVLAALDR